MVIKTAVLKELETLYTQSGNQLCVLYCRPDLEKELLLKTFLQNKKAFYYRARYASPEAQKQMMAEALEEKLQIRLQKYDYEEYFNRIKSGGPEKLILVIDEFSYIAKKDMDFINAVIKLKAKKLYPGPVLILLCSSVVSWVEKEMENCIGTDALKRVDQTIKLSNLNFLEVVRALPDYPVSECIRVYGVIGGVTGYINHWNPKMDLKTNICRQILSRNGYMYNKAENIIGASLRELSVYDTILACIAGGCDKLNDLYLKTGFSRAKISVYMKNLAASDIIEKTGNIDIIAQNEVRENLVGLCNWEKPQVTMEMCEELFENMKKAKISANYYFLFSASTFEQAVVEMAEQDKRFVLIDMNEL